MQPAPKRVSSLHRIPGSGQSSGQSVRALLRSLQREKRVADAMLRVAEDAGRTLSLPDVLDRLCRLSVELVPCDRTTIYLWSERRQAFTPVADHGTPAWVGQRFNGRCFRRGTILGEERLIAGETLTFSRDDELTPEQIEMLDAAGCHAMALVPTPMRGRTLGAFVCSLEGPSRFGATALRVLNGIAQQATSLIENARLFRDVEKAAMLRARVAQLAAAVNAEPSPQAIARLVCRQGAELFHVQGAILFLREGDELVACGASGPVMAFMESVRVPLTDAAYGIVHAFRNGSPLFVNDLGDHPAPNTRLARSFGLKCFLFIPLLGPNGPIGCIAYGDSTRSHCFNQAVLEEGVVLGGIATTALQKAQLFQQAVHANDALRVADAAKDDFLARVSHDLRSPLNVITGYTQMLEEGACGPLCAEQADVLARVKRSAFDQLALVEDLLDLSAMQARDLRLELGPVALGELFAELEETVVPLLRGRPIRFASEVGTDARVVEADRRRLKQLLTNLLANAIRFTADGTIRLTAERAGDRVAIRVVDTGSGIDPADLERIFRPFWQAESASRDHRCSGLGLAIVAELAAAMAGTLAVESTPGTGSVFTVTLPAASGAGGS